MTGVTVISVSELNLYILRALLFNIKISQSTSKVISSLYIDERSRQSWTPPAPLRFRCRLSFPSSVWGMPLVAPNVRHAGTIDVKERWAEGVHRNQDGNHAKEIHH